MDCHLVGAKPLFKAILGYWEIDVGDQTSVRSQWNWYIFIKENAFEYAVWEMAAILSRPQWVKLCRSRISTGTTLMHRFSEDASADDKVTVYPR